MSQPASKTAPLAPSSPTLCSFLERNQHFAATCDPELLAKSSEGQSPSVFWLGCSDSRVPEGVVIRAGVGEVFVHRNVANVFNPSDTSATAALAFAVNNLKVRHVVVVGHESCGGCAAALASALAPVEANKTANGATNGTKHGVTNGSVNGGLNGIANGFTNGTENGTEPTTEAPSADIGEAALARWIGPIRALAVEQLARGVALDLSSLVATNVRAQVQNVIEHDVIKRAWARGQDVSVHGWVYDLASGKVTDLGLSQSRPSAETS